MQINTKFSINDYVYTIINKHIERVRIQDIIINVYGDGDIVIIYFYFNNNDCNYAKECDLFVSKEELLKSL